MKIQNKALIDIDGTPLREPAAPTRDKDGKVVEAEGPILYVAKVLERAALMPPHDGKPFTDKENADRYAAAVYLHQVEPAAPFELEVDTVTILKGVVMRSYAPLVAGQMVPILEGK